LWGAAAQHCGQFLVERLGDLEMTRRQSPAARLPRVPYATTMEMRQRKKQRAGGQLVFDPRIKAPSFYRQLSGLFRGTESGTEPIEKHRKKQHKT
jgi:hypothetical protein